MNTQQYVFDSNAIYRLIREAPEKALEKLNEGTTIYLAYYELGTALWRECHLLKRISVEEAEKSLDLMYMMLLRMQLATVKNGNEVLSTANEFNLTFYDSAYLVEAKQNNRILVTDDTKLAKTATTLGVATIPSSTLINS